MTLGPRPGGAQATLAAAKLHAQHHQIADTHARPAVQALPPFERHSRVAVRSAEQPSGDGRDRVGVAAATYRLLKGSPEVGRA